MPDPFEIPKDLDKFTVEEQKNVADQWFRSNFTDPANRLPYISAEGGYQWIYGGPYDAREELESELGGIVQDSVIDDLATELTEECWEWAPIEDPSEYEDQLLEYISEYSDAHATFCSSIQDTESLCKAVPPDGLDALFYRMLFAQVITIMETYFSDCFISRVLNDNDILRKYLETTPEFGEKKIPLSETLSAADNMQSTIKKQLSDVIWHNIGKVKNMYRDTLEVSFPSDLADIYKSINTRHDIVHRNGRNKDGEEVVVTAKVVYDLLQSIKQLEANIESQLT